MKVLVLGSGGREHALVWKLRESQLMTEIYCAPGNAGIAQEAECFPVDLANPAAMLELATTVHADLTVVGPEAALAAGVVDVFEKAGLMILGPSRAATQFESSKIFAKQFMMKYGVPTARFAVAERFEQAILALDAFPPPVVIKADGLAAGKGVVVAKTREETEKALDHFMRRGLLGAAGSRVVIEEKLSGEEVSFIVLTDGRGLLAFPPSQDHKALLENGQGPNTGGMGAYSDDAILDEKTRDAIRGRIVNPTLAGMAADGIVFRGFLYFGLMLTAEGPKLLEYNVRLGDPEAQALLIRLRSDLLELFVATTEGTLSARDPHWSPNPAVCVVAASRGYPGAPETGKLITGYDLAETVGGVKVFHAGTTFRNDQLLTSSGRVLGVAASGEDLEAAMQRVYAALSKIHFEGMQYRRDIGVSALRRGARSAQDRGVTEGSAQSLEPRRCT
ncbi:MAG: phosphoribosylamine--glycine ligase [Terriglobia bacterium]